MSIQIFHKNKLVKVVQNLLQAETYFKNEKIRNALAVKNKKEKKVKFVGLTSRLSLRKGLAGNNNYKRNDYRVIRQIGEVILRKDPIKWRDEEVKKFENDELIQVGEFRNEVVVEDVDSLYLFLKNVIDKLRDYGRIHNSNHKYKIILETDEGEEEESTFGTIQRGGNTISTEFLNFNDVIENLKKKMVGYLDQYSEGFFIKRISIKAV